MDSPGHTTTSKEIVDFADPNDCAAGGGEPVQQGYSRRLEGEVAPIGRPNERARCTDERTRDDARDPETASDDLKGDVADAIEIIDSHDLLVGGDLEHA